MAISARLLENRRSALGIFLLQGILPDPGDSPLPVRILSRHWLTAQTQQQDGIG
jgi:hypothetical protein